jgi:hypothetical protein
MTTNGNRAGGLGHGYYFEDLSVGMEANYTKKITDKDVLAFAELSGGSPTASSRAVSSPPCSGPSSRVPVASICPKA